MGFCTILKRYFIVPITSLLTLGLTGFISYCYWISFIPALFKDEMGALAIFLLLTFSIFPILIYWVLFQIVCGDPGIVTKKVHDKILRDNNIDPSRIGIDITMKDVLETLTINTLIKNNLISREEV
jgi:hypothetical protein